MSTAGSDNFGAHVGRPVVRRPVGDGLRLFERGLELPKLGSVEPALCLLPVQLLLEKPVLVFQHSKSRVSEVVWILVLAVVLNVSDRRIGFKSSILWPDEEPALVMFREVLMGLQHQVFVVDSFFTLAECDRFRSQV